MPLPAASHWAGGSHSPAPWELQCTQVSADYSPPLNLIPPPRTFSLSLWGQGEEDKIFWFLLFACSSALARRKITLGFFWSLPSFLSNATHMVYVLSLGSSDSNKAALTHWMHPRGAPLAELALQPTPSPDCTL